MSTFLSSRKTVLSYTIRGLSLTKTSSLQSFCEPPGFLRSKLFDNHTSDLPFIKSTGAYCKTSIAAFETDDNASCALAATADSDGAMGPLDSVHERALQGGLHNLSRNNGCRYLFTISNCPRLRAAWTAFSWLWLRDWAREAQPAISKRMIIIKNF